MGGSDTISGTDSDRRGRFRRTPPGLALAHATARVGHATARVGTRICGWVAYVAAIVACGLAAALALAWLASGCATTGATEGKQTVVANPEACALESLHCATSQWPKCGPIPTDGALPSEIIDYSLCALGAAVDCYKQVTGPGEPCEKVEVK